MDMLPILQLDEADKDERFDGVNLIEFGADWKKTAEDCGDHWQIRDWVISDSGNAAWYCEYMFSIDKELIVKLAGLGHNTEITGSALLRQPHLTAGLGDVDDCSAVC